MLEQRYLTVAALTKYIKRKFDADPHLRDIHVKGEISNLKKHTSGHLYFTLKDEKARILAVMFSSQTRGMKFQPENGMKVVVRGEISLFESSGQYQIYVKEMKPDGIGELFLAYEQLKKKLEGEGLFLPHKKQKLPPYPDTIGVITSPTGAAVRDIITTIKRRYPIAKILVFPALVQGENAAPSIVKAIQKANDFSALDVIILGRGGGSIEELWAFNEEAVARSIYSSNVPIISAVGHETDFTIADFVADLRAPTPTAAAELAVPHIDEMLERVLSRQTRLLRAMKDKFRYEKEKLNRLQKSYAFRYPMRLYEQKLEQLDKVSEQLLKGAQKLASLKTEKHLLIHKRLLRSHPSQLLANSSQQYERSQKSLNRAMLRLIAQKQSSFQQRLSTLQALSPLKIMERGYSLAYSENNHLLKSVHQVKENDFVKIKVADGDLLCQVQEIREMNNNES